jgi:glutamyl-tRNA synthetase
LRIEDLDTPRTKSGAEALVLEDLEWLGLDWDRDASSLGFARQSERTNRYAEVLDQLKSRELIYPCTCSRSEIEEAASAPHESFLDGTVYNGKCASNHVADAMKFEQQGTKYAWRFRFSPMQTTTWIDQFAGQQTLIPSQSLGDFIVARNYGPVAYQLAVVVDDHDSDINNVVRGDDLIYSTYRQLAIYDALQWKAPSWIHLPLVVGNDGRRLAKRHGDSRLKFYREQGVKPEELLNAIAQSLGLTTNKSLLNANQILDLAQQSSDWLHRIPAAPFQWTL